MPPTKIFVGSLPQGVKPDELRTLFQNYGEVVECDVMNRCGFVHMGSDEMANTAIMALNNTEFRGQNIVVEIGRPKDKKVGGGGRGGIGGNPRGSHQAGGIGGRGGGGGGRGGGMRGSGRGGGGGGGNGRGGGNRMQGGMAGGLSGGQRNNFGPGPIRGDGFKGQRNAPYSKRGGGGNGDAGGGGAFGGGFNSRGGGGGGGGGFASRGGSGGAFAGRGGGAGGFGNRGGVGAGNSGGPMDFNNWEGDDMGNINMAGGFGGGNRNFAENEFSNGFSGNMSHVGGGFAGKNSDGGQDRRGFALPPGGQQDGRGQHFGSGNQGGGFGGGNQGGGFGGASNGGDESSIFSRRSSFPNMSGTGNRGNQGGQGGRGGWGGRGDFGGGRGGGGFGGGRGGGGNRGGGRGAGGGRGGGPQNNSGRGVFKRGGIGGGNGGASASSVIGFLTTNIKDFPPLGALRGARGGGMQRNGPRQNMMPNRRN